METVEVVTAFLRNRGDVLLVRRSDAVGTYAGRWGAVSGYTEGDPEALVPREIREETDLDDAVALVRRGDPVSVEDPDLGTRWVVHPFLFDSDSRAVDPNEEIADHEWVPPTAIRDRETVPALWTAYDRVRPTVADVADDRTRGAATLSLRALAVLRDEAALAEGWDDVAEVGRALATVRPSMPALATRVDRAMTEATVRTPAAVERAAEAALDEAATADEGAAKTAADLAGDRVCTLSRSGTVRETLRRAAPARVVVLESRPGGEGVEVAGVLAGEGADRGDGVGDRGTGVSLAPDAAVAHVVATEGVDTVLVGADAVLPDGSVVNKVGTRTAATVADGEGVEVVVACARDKVAPTGTRDVDREQGAGEWAAVDAGVAVIDPTFDRTPAALVDAVATEDGVLGEADVARVAEEHAALAAWRT